jgi:hypothetical protein
VGEDQTKRNILDGVTFVGPPVPDDKVVVDALCVLRVQSVTEGRSQIIVYRTPGVDDVTETGMLYVASLKDRILWERPLMRGGEG